MHTESDEYEESLLKGFAFHYYLDGKNPKKVTTVQDIERISNQMTSGDFSVKVTDITYDLITKVKKGAGKGRTRMTRLHKCEISTAFLPVPPFTFGCQTSFFETMLFSRDEAVVLHRYETWDEALRSHNEIAAQKIKG